MTALVEPPIAALTRIAFANAVRREDLRQRDIVAHELDDAAAGRSGRAPAAANRRPESRRSAAGRRRAPRPCRPCVDAVPIVLQVPTDRLIAASASRNSSIAMRPAFNSSCSRQTAVPEPMISPRWWPDSIGPPETTIAGTSQLAAPISSAGVVLSQPTSSTTPSIGLARIDSSTSMLARLRNSIAVGPHVRFAERGHREFDREAAGFVYAAPHPLGEVAQVRVARRQFRPRVADADDRPSLEQVLGEALVLHPASVHECVLAGAFEPRL